MSTIKAGGANIVTRHVWFHGLTFDATATNRVALTETLFNGYCFCEDIYAGQASTIAAAVAGQSRNPETRIITGSGGIVRKIKGSTERYSMNVCKPATAVLGRFAGVLVNAPPTGITPEMYSGGVALELAFDAELVETRVLGNLSTAGAETILVPTNAQWYLSVASVSTNGANLHQWVGRPVDSFANIASAANVGCSLGPFGKPTQH